MKPNTFLVQIPFPNSHRVDSKRDGQYYRLANQKLDRNKVPSHPNTCMSPSLFTIFGVQLLTICLEY